MRSARCRPCSRPPRRAVEPGPLQERRLASAATVVGALPCVQRRRLQRAAVGERQLPRVRAPAVHRVEVRGRVLVALPAGQEHDPGHGGGHDVAEAARSSSRRPARPAACTAHCLPEITMFGLSSMPSSATPWSYSASNTACSVARVTCVAALDGVVGVHQHFRLDDRHDALVLAQRGVPSERVRVDHQAVPARDAVADRDHRAPLREPRAEPAVLDEPLARGRRGPRSRARPARTRAASCPCRP